MVTLRLSSYMDKKDLDLMAIWMRQELTLAHRAEER